MFINRWLAQHAQAAGDMRHANRHIFLTLTEVDPKSPAPALVIALTLLSEGSHSEGPYMYCARVRPSSEAALSALSN